MDLGRLLAEAIMDMDGRSVPGRIMPLRFQTRINGLIRKDRYFAETARSGFVNPGFGVPGER